MKILIIGFGKMGRLIHQKALQQGHEIAGTITSTNIHELDDRWVDKVDCAIEFTNPIVAVSNILKCQELGIPIVTGSTGWEDQVEKIHNAVEKHNGSLFYSSNYSIGANILFNLNEQLAKIMALQKQYQPQIIEVHHLQKKDSPSGTAITLANEIIQNTDKIEWTNHESKDTDAINIISIREDNVPGTHTVSYNCPIDNISIKHVAHNREGFALGALLAASFLQAKKGIFTMKDLI